jgi:hypothetical protein
MKCGQSRTENVRIESINCRKRKRRRRRRRKKQN